MIDLSKYPCPLCKNTAGNSTEEDRLQPPGTYLAYCGGCAFGIEGPDGSEQSAANAWTKLSEAVHGKPHDGPTVEVRIAVAVDAGGGWGVEALFGCSREEALQEAGRWLLGQRSYHIITATIPVPVAQEIKGRVEG